VAQNHCLPCQHSGLTTACCAYFPDTLLFTATAAGNFAKSGGKGQRHKRLPNQTRNELLHAAQTGRKEKDHAAEKIEIPSQALRREIRIKLREKDFRRRITEVARK
jgi:hypothetical protein